MHNHHPSIFAYNKVGSVLDKFQTGGSEGKCGCGRHFVIKILEEREKVFRNLRPSRRLKSVGKATKHIAGSDIAGLEVYMSVCKHSIILSRVLIVLFSQ